MAAIRAAGYGGRDGLRVLRIITFLVALSGVVLGGVGSAFWGVVAGAIALMVQQYGRSLR